VLRIPNVQNGALDLDDIKFASPTLSISAREAIASGDMLVVRTNGSKALIGRAAVVLAPPTGVFAYASYLIRFRLMNLESLAHWVSVVWQGPTIRSWVEAHAATSAGQHNISMTTLATAAVPLPPFLEQHRIVAEVDRRLSLLRETEVQVDANLQRAERLRQSILIRAFNPAMVSHDGYTEAA
jgi:type I restriction enzyme S subunit